MSENILGKNLRIARKELGLTQIDFAEKLGISNGYVSDIEKGKAKPSESVLRNIENQFRINRNWLLTGKGDKCLSRNTVLEVQSGNVRLKDGCEDGRSVSETITATFTDLDPDIFDLLKKTRQILESETEYAFSLAANVRSFHRSVENEKRLVNHERRIAQLEKLKDGNGGGGGNDDHPSGAVGNVINGKGG